MRWWCEFKTGKFETYLFSHCAPVLSEPSSERMSADIFSHMDFLFLNVFIGPTSCLYSRNLSIKSLASGSLQKLWAVQITYSIVLICGDFYWQRANHWTSGEHSQCVFCVGIPCRREMWNRGTLTGTEIIFTFLKISNLKQIVN